MRVRRSPLQRFEKVKEAMEVKKTEIREWVDRGFTKFHEECNQFLERTFASADYSHVSRNSEVREALGRSVRFESVWGQTTRRRASEPSAAQKSVEG